MTRLPRRNASAPPRPGAPRPRRPERARRRRRGATGAPRRDLRPSLFVVGTAPFSADVAVAVAERLGAGHHVAALDDALGCVDVGTLALVFTIDPARRGEVERVESELRQVAAREDLATLHRFAVVPAERPPSLARRLYRAAASAVFEWPGERSRMPDALVDLLGGPPRRLGSDDDDRALGRGVRARIQAGAVAGESVLATASGGIVVLAGAAASAARKRAIEAEVRRVPGVRHVVSHQLRAGGDGRPAGRRGDAPPRGAPWPGSSLARRLAQRIRDCLPGARVGPGAGRGS